MNMSRRTSRPLRKSIAIVGEGVTEQMYFAHLKDFHELDFSLQPELPKHPDYMTIFKKAKDLIRKKYDFVLCVIDLDKICEESKFKDFQKECLKLSSKIIPITSNPCIELWFLQHFLSYPSARHFSNYKEIAQVLKVHLPEYGKTRKYYRKRRPFSEMERNGGIERARKNSFELLKHLESTRDCEHKSYTEVGLSINRLIDCRSCSSATPCTACLEEFTAATAFKEAVARK